MCECVRVYVHVHHYVVGATIVPCGRPGRKRSWIGIYLFFQPLSAKNLFLFFPHNHRRSVHLLQTPAIVAGISVVFRESGYTAGSMHSVIDGFCCSGRRRHVLRAIYSAASELIIMSSTRNTFKSNLRCADFARRYWNAAAVSGMDRDGKSWLRRKSQYFIGRAPSLEECVARKGVCGLWRVWLKIKTHTMHSLAAATGAQ